MIHTIFVEPSTSLPDLKKETRKRLMTGGAAIRLRPELQEVELSSILATVLAEAKSNNIASEVLVQIARHPSLNRALEAELRGTGLSEVLRALGERKL